MAFTSLNALHSFLAVARHGSFAKAARELGVSSSALSQSVQQLEARTGVALLRRTSRSVALTDAGRRLLEEAGPGIERALDALKAVDAKLGDVTGRLKLSVPSAAIATVLTRVVPRFVERHPKVVLDVRVENKLVDIVAGGFDAGIRLVDRVARDMAHVRLSGPARIVVVGAPAYLERRGIPRTPEDLAQHDCFGLRWPPDAEPLAWEFVRGKKTWRIPVRGPVVTDDRELAYDLALKGKGLVFGLEPAFAEHLVRKRLQVVLEAYARTVPGLFLYFPSRAQGSPALRAFVGVCREVAKEIVKIA